MMLRLYNHKAIKWLLLLTLLTVTAKTADAQVMDRVVQRSAPLDDFGGRLNPDLSVVVDLQSAFGDVETYKRNRVMLPAIEVVVGGYLHPGIRGDVVTKIKNCYEGYSPEVELEVEETFISFLQLPLGLQLIAGRRLVDFGRVNQFHGHHLPFVNRPLISEHLFGCCAKWADEGLNLSFLVPNPLDVYLKASVSALSGRLLCDDNEAVSAISGRVLNEAGEVVRWRGSVLNSRVSMDLPWIHSVVGYSRAWNEAADTSIENIEITYRYHWPGFARRHLRLQSEYFWARQDGRKTNPGFYCLALFSFDRYIEIGARYDALLLAEGNALSTWAGSFFATWYWSCTMYLRGQYSYKEEVGTGEGENKFFVQLNWGMGPHAHRLED